MYLLGALIGGLTVLALGMGVWAARGPVHVDPACERCTLRHHVVARMCTLFGLLFPGTIVVLFAREASRGGEEEAVVGLIASAPCVGFTLVGAYLFVETWAFRVVVSDAAVMGYSAWRPAVRIPWAEVVEVSYSAADACFIFTGPDGREVRAPVYLGGAATLASAILERLDPAVYAGAHAGFAALGTRLRLRWDDTRWADRLRGGHADAIRAGEEASPVRLPPDEFREGEP